MTVEELKQAVLNLPDRDVGEFYCWLDELIRREIWPRQIAHDIREFGIEKWRAALAEDMAQASEQRKSALRRLRSGETLG